MTADPPGPSKKEFDARLRTAQARRAEREGGTAPGARGSGLSAGFHVATELVVAMMVAVAIGWFLDEWLETRPLFLVIFFFLGAAAGALNVYRRARQIVGGEDKDGENRETVLSAKPPEEEG